MVDLLASRETNLLGSSKGAGAACEVELDLCLFDRIYLCGAIRLDLGLEFRKTKKMRKREREREKETKNLCKRKMKNRWGFKKKFKILFATQRRRSLRRDKVCLRSGAGVYTAAYQKGWKFFLCDSTQRRRDLRCSLEIYAVA